MFVGYIEEHFILHKGIFSFFFYLFRCPTSYERAQNTTNDWCNEKGISKSFFSEWTNNIKNKINNRIEVLNNTLHKYKQFDALSSPAVRAALENVHKYFVVVPIDKTTGNIALMCKQS